MLYFIYTAQVSDLSLDGYKELLKAADQYQLLGLKGIKAGRVNRNVFFSSQNIKTGETEVPLFKTNAGTRPRR